MIKLPTVDKRMRECQRCGGYYAITRTHYCRKATIRNPIPFSQLGNDPIPSDDIDYGTTFINDNFTW